MSTGRKVSDGFHAPCWRNLADDAAASPVTDVREESAAPPGGEAVDLDLSAREAMAQLSHEHHASVAETLQGGDVPIESESGEICPLPLR